MNVQNTLILTIIYTSIIYTNNVVYCTEAGTDQTGSSLESQANSTTPKNEESSSTLTSSSTEQTQGSLTESTNQSQSKVSSNTSQLDTKGLKLFAKDIDGNKVDLDSTLYESRSLFKDKNVLVFNLKDNSKCSSVEVDNKLIWSLDNNETPLLDNGQKEYPLKVFYTLPSDTFEQSHNHLRSYFSTKLVFVVFKHKHLHYMLLNDKWVLKTNEDIPANEYSAFIEEASARVNALTKGSGQMAAEQPVKKTDPSDQSHSPDSDFSCTSPNQQSSGYILNVDTTSHDNTKYDLEADNIDKKFTFKPNVKCSEVKCNNIAVWKTGDQSINEPKSVLYNSNDNQITVRDDKSSVLYKKKTDGTWYHFTTVKIESDVTSSGEDNVSKQTESSDQPGDGSTDKTSVDSQPQSGSTLTSGTGEVLLSNLYPDGFGCTYAWDYSGDCSSDKLLGSTTTDPNQADSGSKTSEQSKSSSTSVDPNKKSSSQPSDSDKGTSPASPSQQPSHNSSSSPKKVDQDESSKFSTTPSAQQQSEESKSSSADQSGSQKSPVAKGTTPPTKPSSNEGTGTSTGSGSTSAKTSSTSPGTDSTKECHLKIYAKDPNDSSKTIELDHSKIKPVGDKGDNKLYKYEFGDQVKPNEVKYSDESVWKHGDHKTQEHPKFIFYHELVKIVLVEVPKDTFHFYRKRIKDKQWAHEQLTSTDKVERDNVKLYTDTSGQTELSANKYSVKVFPFAVEFALKDDANCKQLKYENNKYTFSEDESGKYPRNICFFNNKNCVIVYKSQASYKTPDK